MPRYKLTIEYDGGPFAGWQRQNNGYTVQQALEDAVFLMSGERITVHGAGRTDAGVHARGQAAHIDLIRVWDLEKIRGALNQHLKPHPVSVLNVEPAAADFEARFSALRRHYLYIIDNRRAPPALDRNRVWHVARKIDAEAMHAAAQLLVGRHDFTTFRAAECQANSPVRTLDALDVTRAGDHVEVRTNAQSYLHNQVRSLVGSLEHVGSGRWSAIDLRAALEARDRARCGVVAPARGLYLMQVDY